MSEERKAYERFKLQWMIDHGFMLNDLVTELQTCLEEREDHYLPAIFKDWEFGYGFGSQIWPCYEEYLGCEYQEEQRNGKV